MNAQKVDHLLESLTLQSPLSLLLRVLCACSCSVIRLDEDAAAFSMERERIFPLIEKWGADIGIGEIPSLVPAADNESLRRMGREASVLCISREGAYVTTLGNVAFHPEEGVFPVWWEIPLPLVRFDGEKISCNREARERFGSHPFTPPVEEGEVPGEFFANSSSKNSATFVLRLLEGEFYTIEDVTEDVQRADEILWWASIGRALSDYLKETGTSVERVGNSRKIARDDIPCVWDGKTIGYLRIRADREKR
jgi:hypothetical protein